MCGIVGWLSTSESKPVDPSALVRMRDCMVHRGPDGEGLWVSENRRIGFGFRRLAIVDLSAAANQPMQNEDGSVRIVFNGEIYNHKLLRRELTSRGHRFCTDHSDTESIVHGYEEWGERVVDHLEGMFAFAIWDQAHDCLFLARDRIGIKPLYFGWTDSGFLFASEIKSILALPSFARDLEPRSVYHYLSFLTTPAPLTMFRGIYKMPAGHRAFVAFDGAMKAERYWDALPGSGDDLAEMRSLQPPALEDYAVRRTRELLDAAIEKRMMSDVPFGVFLSGGIDSSTNVALMSRHMTHPVRTFTVGFSDHQHLNELEYARKVSRLFHTEHHEIMVDERSMREYLPSLIYSQDEPIADWVCIPLYFVSKLLRDNGTIVVQVGEGSDEQFCGYRSYMMYLTMYRRFWRRFAGLPRPLRRVFSKAGGWLMGLHDRHDAYIDVIIRAGLDREAFWSGATVVPESRKARIIDLSRLAELRIPPPMWASGLLPREYAQPDSFGIVRSFFDRLDKSAPGSDFLTRMIYSEFKLRLPELLLMRVDKVGMSVSIEPRVPFLDHKLVEFTMNLPMQLKTRNGVTKWVLKQAVRGLIPDEIIDRPKMGFGAPMVQWLRGDFGRSMESEMRATRFFDHFPANRDTVLGMLHRHQAGKADFALYLWTFYNAAAWYDSWIDRRAS
ncbi:MAG TPA: asparagine synthase (glutamine-hydrolyzing) [Acidobacteriota bacterium]|nr:asparagine synthase (glutamine-hydrolyzing) [Acidobacteriota bacterium]